MSVVNGVVEDDIPNGLQQVAVRFGRLGDLGVPGAIAGKCTIRCPDRLS
jgi:hypothetical protein